MKQRLELPVFLLGSFRAPLCLAFPYRVCGKQTHLLFGLALSLSDVTGDDSLCLFPQSRK